MLKHTSTVGSPSLGVGYPHLAVEGNPDGRCNLTIGVPASAWLRQAVIVSLTAAVLCPLSLLKDLSALSFLPWPYP